MTQNFMQVPRDADIGNLVGGAFLPPQPVPKTGKNQTENLEYHQLYQNYTNGV